MTEQRRPDARVPLLVQDEEPALLGPKRRHHALTVLVIEQAQSRPAIGEPELGTPASFFVDQLAALRLNSNNAAPSPITEVSSRL